MEFSLLVKPIFPPAELVKIANYLEESGFHAFWLPDEKFYRDCYIGLSLVASNTNHLHFGPCVSDPYSRHPIMTAAAIATLAEVAPGRTWLGLGAGGRGFNAMNISREHPATALREAVIVIRRLLKGEIVDFQGEVIRLNNRQLDFVPNGSIPILIGTGFGHAIQKLAGEIADAVMLANYASPGPIQAVLDRVSLGGGRVGRSLKDTRLISRIDLAIHEDSKQARNAVTPAILSTIRASYPSLSYLEDLPDLDLSSRLLNVIKDKNYQTRRFYSDISHSSDLIPDSLIHHLSVAGSPGEVTDKLTTILDLGRFDEIAISLHPCIDQTYFTALNQLSRVIDFINP